ncbi:S41 family peptidase [Maribacter polysaccharolyticus]|uniref:S41 family peptidase n=1 Tax=Maribacter polysaccharolyticus TaxID=3020831 RepID=UPI00237FA15C|nr:S41 family peptidase [Maribacter polysaccharolyticus]MDE3740728.1 S41 family peptidase [Maribacter polysaccharolyticus]
MKKYVLLFLSLGVLLNACKKSDDDLTPSEGIDPEESADVEVQDFMWKAMNFWYFWQADVPNLADDKFANTEEGIAAYTEFLSSESDPGDFFDNQLLYSEDRFSFYSEDYQELTQAFAGISKSNGLEYGLVKYSDSDDVFGYVMYIVPDSDAATKDISRGDIFTGVDGQTLNIDNYIDLLFGDSDTYTLNMADISDNVITPNDKEVELTKLEGLVENPVFLSKTFDISGEKIGYLVYNGFTNEFDEDLNDAFGTFKAEGVTNLILDLRYNPGGSVNSARLLSSMIYGTNEDEVFLRQRWNDKIQAQLSDSQLVDYFAKETSDGSAINTLNLSKVYIIATYNSASASELVINGLAPYVDVVHIGETTRGKNEFSITMVDDYGYSYIYNSERESEINPDNQWAIQPLVGRNENADGFYAYTDGLDPDIELEEDLENLGTWGDLNEPLLARAIQEITGQSAKRSFEVGMPANAMTNSKMFSILKDNMVLDKPLELEVPVQ